MVNEHYVECRYETNCLGRSPLGNTWVARKKGLKIGEETSEVTRINPERFPDASLGIVDVAKGCNVMFGGSLFVPITPNTVRLVDKLRGLERQELEEIALSAGVILRETSVERIPSAEKFLFSPLYEHSEFFASGSTRSFAGDSSRWAFAIAGVLAGFTAPLVLDYISPGSFEHINDLLHATLSPVAGATLGGAGYLLSGYIGSFFAKRDQKELSSIYFTGEFNKLFAERKNLVNTLLLQDAEMWKYEIESHEGVMDRMFDLMASHDFAAHVSNGLSVAVAASNKGKIYDFYGRLLEC